MQLKREPIIAQATAIGKAGIGVVRISGEGLQPLLEKLSIDKVLPRHARLMQLKDAQDQLIDQ